MKQDRLQGLSGASLAADIAFPMRVERINLNLCDRGILAEFQCLAGITRRKAPGMTDLQSFDALMMEAL